MSGRAQGRPWSPDEWGFVRAAWRDGFAPAADPPSQPPSQPSAGAVLGNTEDPGQQCGRLRAALRRRWRDWYMATELVAYDNESLYWDKANSLHYHIYYTGCGSAPVSMSIHASIKRNISLSASTLTKTISCHWCSHLQRSWWYKLKHYSTVAYYTAALQSSRYHYKAT